MTETEIRELKTEPEWRAAFPVMRQLRTHLDADEFVSLVRGMRGDGYRLFALAAEGDDAGDREVVALVGVGISTNMYHGRHAWVYELVTDADHRSKGYGGRLLSFVEEWAAKEGCERLALSSGLQRADAHRFYEERAEMDRASYVFTKPL
ncbi:GNAT family N-acetyltransferase [Halegenticoccus tardaugens]|uniref:GNAT family N-acetyltransferase n=1 Tax=Halegenticoccus tardaugens TaxID=2071624 RepID=UPI00100BC242|nr:GNAT family N-acetyltransferase [Halegenticoccus tardaugens]